MSSFEQQNNSNVNLSIDHQLIEEGGLYISHLLLKELLGSIYSVVLKDETGLCRDL